MPVAVRGGRSIQSIQSIHIVSTYPESRTKRSFSVAGLAAKKSRGETPVHQNAPAERAANTAPPAIIPRHCRSSKNSSAMALQFPEMAIAIAAPSKPACQPYGASSRQPNHIMTARPSKLSPYKTTRATTKSPAPKNGIYICSAHGGYTEWALALTGCSRRLFG